MKILSSLEVYFRVELVSLTQKEEMTQFSLTILGLLLW